MKFLRLGHRYLNLEMITDIYVQDRRPAHPEVIMDVYLASVESERSFSEAQPVVQTRHVRISGEDADRLIQWLETQLVPG